MVEIANASEHSAGEIADLHFTLSAKFSVDDLLTAITRLPRDDRWSTLARAAVRHDVYAALSSITTAVLRSTSDEASADERTAIWMHANAERVERARARCARRWSATRSTWRRCRSRCASCAACPAEVPPVAQRAASCATTSAGRLVMIVSTPRSATKRTSRGASTVQT